MTATTTHAQKGERYARIFRKAGTFLAKGNIARAIELFKEGEDLARSAGDVQMADQFAAEIMRHRHPAENSH